MNIKPPECWSVDPQTRGLRVELSPGHSFVFPLEHFVYSEFEIQTDRETLKLVFATHEIVLHGSVLRRVEQSMQRMELAAVVAAPVKYQPLAGQTQPFITKITVVPAEPQSSSPTNSENTAEKEASHACDD